MSLQLFILLLFVAAGVLALFAFACWTDASRAWRSRRRFGGLHRIVWGLVFAAFALLFAFGGFALIGYKRLTAEARIATVETHRLEGDRYAVTVELPDGTRREATLAGDEWQLDARIVKWQPRAVVLGAPPLYRLDRIGGRWRDVERERTEPRTVTSLSDATALDLWTLKRQFPRWLPWIDADYGSGAYLPFVDGGRFDVSLAAAGGLVARPADDRTRTALQDSGWSSQ